MRAFDFSLVPFAMLLQQSVDKNVFLGVDVLSFNGSD